MTLNKFFRMTAFVAVVFAFVACDEDFTEIGGEIINNPSNVELREIEVNAYSQKINSVQTNNLNNLFLGSITHPEYGESTASIVTQLRLSRVNPSFGENVQLDSVVMTVPYYSTAIASDENNGAEFQLDSVYGSGNFKLSVYETSFFLNDLDPAEGFEQRQKYYSDQQEIIESNLIELDLVGGPIYTDNSFSASAQSYTSYEIGEDNENDTIVNEPAFRIKLPTGYFQRKIISKAGSEELRTNTNFTNYFRNLFFKAESNGGEGNQILMNLSNQDARIRLYYTSDIESNDGTTENVRGSYDLNFSGANHFNTYEGSFPDNISQKIESQTSETGAENLYVKGQEGSMAVIELFPDNEVLESLKEEKLLINEADLTFYVNESLASDNLQPRRLFLFDLTNNTIISDYAIDPGFNSNPEISLSTFSQPLKVAEDANGSFYKLRITNHVSNIINNDFDNVKLGLVVVANINTLASRNQQGAILGAITSATRNVSSLVDQVPSGSLLSPYGTVLHGNLSTDNDKRLKLNIYYTNYN